MHKLFSRTFAALALSLLATIAQTGAAKAPSAPITFSQTRVVFNEGAKSASIDVTNKSETPYMLATSVRLVSVDRQTTRNDRAFSAVPPVRLLMPGETLTVRIVKTGLASREGAGDDVSRAEDGNAVVESARLIRFKMVPAQEKNAHQKPVVRAVITTTLKLFYRPTMLIRACAKRQRRSTPTASWMATVSRIYWSRILPAIGSPSAVSNGTALLYPMMYADKWCRRTKGGFTKRAKAVPSA